MDEGGEQGDYQVRFEWGVAGLARLANCDVVVIVDVLDRAGDGEAERAVLETAAESGAPLVITSSVQDAAAVAERILREQAWRSTRTSISIIAVGDPPHGRERDADAALRFAVEDLLGAGAVVHELGALGIDHTSPAAAAAGEAFGALRGGLRHLISATPAGRALVAAGRGHEVITATS